MVNQQALLEVQRRIAAGQVIDHIQIGEKRIDDSTVMIVYADGRTINVYRPITPSSR